MTANAESAVVATHTATSRAGRITGLVVFSVWSGSLLGAFAYAIGRPFFSLISLPSGLLLSVIFGTSIGFACSPLVVFSLARRDHQLAKPLILWCSVMIAGVAAFVFPADKIFALMGVAAIGFVASCLFARILLPKHWDVSGLCRRCGYDVRASLQFKRCPECGTGLNEDTPFVRLREKAAGRSRTAWFARLAYMLVRWPWPSVFILLLLLVVPTCFRDCRRAFRERAILAQYSEAAVSNRAFDLSKAAPFDWDEVYIFGAYADSRTITKSLGVAAGGLNKRVNFVDDSEQLIVFVGNREVVEWAFLRLYPGPPNLPRDKELRGFDVDCLNLQIRRADARFRIVEVPNGVQRFVLDRSYLEATSPAP